MNRRPLTPPINICPLLRGASPSSGPRLREGFSTWHARHVGGKVRDGESRDEAGTESDAAAGKINLGQEIK